MSSNQSQELQVFDIIVAMKSSNENQEPLSPELALTRSLELMEFFSQQAKHNPILCLSRKMRGILFGLNSQ